MTQRRQITYLRLLAIVTSAVMILPAVAGPAAAGGPSPTPSPSASPNPSESPTPTASPAPTAIPMPSASPTPSAGPVSTATSLTSSAATVLRGSTVALTATVAPAPAGGVVLFTDTLNDGRLLGQASFSGTSGVAAIAIGLDPGVHGVTATFGGAPGFLGSASEGLLVAGLNSGTPTQTSFAISPSTVEADVRADVTATVSSGATGTVVFTTGTTVLGSATIDPPIGAATGVVRLQRPGTFQVVATYVGEGASGGSQSAPVPVVVTPDSAVHPVDAGVSASTFYPARDGYLDTVDIRGTLLDTARVSIVISSVATKKKVRTANLGTLADEYAWTWDGRSNSGSALPAGKYRVVQSFRDAAGHTASATAFTTVSPKKLVWKTGSITRNGDDFDGWNASTYAWVSLVYSDFIHGVDLYGNVLDSWAWIDYHFYLPSAVKYGKVTWAVLGRLPSISLSDGPAWLSLWDWTLDKEGDQYSTGTDYAWYSISGPAEDFVSSSREVRAFVSVYGADEGHFDVAEVKLTYTYAVLQ